MDQTYEQALKYMEGTVHELAKHVPKPKRISTKNGFVFRYVEKSIHQAIVQKLARLVSTLYATRLCLLFIHPRAPNLIGLRSAGTMPT